MVTSKALKACVLLWAFVAGLSAASSPFVVSYQNPHPDHATDILLTGYQNPPSDEPPAVSSPPPAYHADNPPPVSYQNPPPVETYPPPYGGITPPCHSWHEHDHPALKPPTNCDIPPANGYNNPSPPPPTGYNNEPPSSGGGGGYQPTPVGSGIAPSPTENDNPPLTPPTGYHYYPPPSTTTTPPPTSTGNTAPSPPYIPHEHIFGGTSDFWKNHPHLMLGLLKWWHATIGRGSNSLALNINFQEAISNTRTDGISSLYREGTTSLLNSMVNKNFPYTTSEVWNSFLAAAHTDKAAAAQAEVFKLANEGRLEPKG